MLLNRITAIGAACLLGFQAAADVSYTMQDRHIEAAVTSDTQRRDAIGYTPFNDSLDVRDSLGLVQASQNSTLGPNTIEGHLFAYASSQTLLGYARADNRLLTEFDLLQPSSFILNGVLDTSDPSGFSLIAFFRFDGPSGNIINYSAQPPSDYYFDFSGEHAIIGTLSAGHYRLEAELNPAVQTGTRSAAAILDFTLTIPTPAAGLVLFISPLLARRLRREIN